MFFLLSEGHFLGFLPKQSLWEPDTSGDSSKFAVLENGGAGD